MATETLRRRFGTGRGAALIAAAAVISMLTACGSTSGSNDASSSSPHGTLQVLVGSADGSNAGFKALSAAFEKKYPKVKVVLDTVQNQNLPAAKSSRLTAGNVDIVYAYPQETPSYASGSESDDTRLAKAGQFLDLTHEPFMKRVTPSVLKPLKIDGKDYVFPTGLSYYTGVFYNKKIFQDNGISVPTTWDEFVADCKKLQSAGVTPIGIGGKDSWPGGLSMQAAVESLYPTLADRQKLASDIWTGKVKLSDPSQVKILDVTSQFYSYAQPHFAGVSYESIPAGFAQGDFAMVSDGTWNETTIATAVGKKFDFGYFPIPMSNDASHNKELGGKIEITLAISSSAPNKQAALAFMNFFSQPANYKIFLDDAGFAPSIEGVKTNSFLQSISQYTTPFQPAWGIIWTANSKAGNAASNPYNYPALTPLGSSTPAEAAKASADAWVAGN